METFKPRTVIWDFTSKCNSRCVYCYDANDVEKQDMTVEQAKNVVLPRFKEAGVKTICFSGGEPLLRFDDILSIATDVKNAGIVEVLLATNATIITKEHIKKFKTAYKGCDIFMSVPLDSLNDEVMQELRPPFANGVFLSKLATKSALKQNVIVTIETVVTSKNFASYPAIFDFTKRCGSLCFAETYPFFKEGRGRDDDELSLSVEQIQSLDEIKMANYGKCLTWDFMPFPVPDDVWNLIKHDARDAQITEGCIAGRDYIQIGNDGTLYPCSFLRIPVGNILEDSLVEVWNSNELLTRMRNRDVSGKCGNCPHVKVCGGCRARAFSETGDPLGGVPSCKSSIDGHVLSKEFGKKVMKTYKKQKFLTKLLNIAKKMRLI